MTWALVQHPAAKSVSTTATTDSLAFASAPTAGNLIVVALAMNADAITFTTAPTLTGVTFGSPIFTDNSTASQSVAFWVVEYAGSSSTVNVTWSTVTGAGGTLSIAEFSGISGTPVVDGTVASIRAASGTSLSYTPGVTGDLLIYYISTTGAVASITGTPWTSTNIEGNMAGSSNAWAWASGTTSPVTGTADEGANDLGVIFGIEAAGGVPPLMLLPASDVVTTGWTPSTGTTLWGVLSDGSDSTFATASI